VEYKLKDAEKAGQLYVAENATSKSKKKCWLALKEGMVYYYTSEKDYIEHKPKKTLALLTSTVKPVVMGSSKERKAVSLSTVSTSNLQTTMFELVTIEKHYFFVLDTKEEMVAWMEKIQDAIANLLNNMTSNKEKATPSSAAELTPEAEWRIIQKESADNCICADCGAADPDWCSINLVRSYYHIY
jgi:hypothetical protein